MVIRKLRADENEKAFAVRSLGYGFSIDVRQKALEPLKDEVIGAFLNDGETLIAIVYILEYKSSFCGSFYPCLGIGGVAALPEYRRLGAIRAIMDEIFKMAPERGWLTSFLHPFSYDYYRQFGYERLVKRIRLCADSDVLRTCPRNTNVQLYSYKNKNILQDILQVYNTYAKSYCGMFFRDEKVKAYNPDPFVSGQHTYVHYNREQKPDAVATIEVFDEDKVNVKEICYIDPAGIQGMLGFLRMYDGQVNEFIFETLPEDSEVDLLLSEYSKVSYTVHSRAMGRVMLLKDLLKRNVYPKEAGHFRLRCEDTQEYNRGVWDVAYESGTATVTKLPGDGPYDISASVPALSRLILQGGYTPHRAAYLETVKINGDAADFFRAFPDRNLFIPDFF